MGNFKYKIKPVSEESNIASNSFFTSGGEGENHTGPSPRKSTYGAYTQAGYKKVSEGPGATMGPGPKAGPTGGLGLAPPAGICNFRIFATFFAIMFSLFE